MSNEPLNIIKPVKVTKKPEVNVFLMQDHMKDSGDTSCEGQPKRPLNISCRMRITASCAKFRIVIYYLR